MGLFDFDNMAKNLQENAFGNRQKYNNEVDTRFWKLSLDADKNGGALIRFMPDPNLVQWITMTMINASHGKGQFFVSEWSPESIGMKDPFAEKFSELWNFTDNKEKDGKKWLCPYKQIALTLGRSERFITNIKVIKDPANPANEGKYFLYNMSPTMFGKIKAAIQPSESEIALGATPMNVYNPLAGNNFLIKARLDTTGFVTYNDSKFDSNVTAMFDSEEEAMADIKANAYELGEFLKPEFFKTEEELTVLLNRFLEKDPKYKELFPSTTSAPASAAVQPSAQTEAAVQAAEQKFAEPVQAAQAAQPAPSAEPAPAAQPAQPAQPAPSAFDNMSNTAGQPAAQPAAQPAQNAEKPEDDLDALLSSL